MILKIFLSFNILTSVVFAKEKINSFCNLQSNPTIKTIKINDVPSFFYKVHPNGKYIGYIGSKGNQLLNFETARVVPIPGSVDPVFSSDGKYLVVPMYKDEFTGPISPGDQILLFDEANQASQMPRITFFPLNNFTSKSNSTSKVTYDKKDFSNYIYKDNENTGVYQSVAASGNDTYQVISDHNGVSIREYKIENNIGEAESKLQTPCSNIEDFPTDLPILSKDGRFISVNNTNTKTTQIYAFKEDNECNLALDLGMATGKVSFNKDSSKITFHMDHFNESMGGYFSGTASDVIKDVYTMNLNKIKNVNGENELIPTNWAKVTHNEVLGNGSYYPDFSDNDELFYLSDINNYFQFSKVHLNQLNYRPFNEFKEIATALKNENACLQLTPELFYQFLLGQTWTSVCTKLESVNVKDSALMAFSIPRTSCEELVLKNWDDGIKNKIFNNFKSNFNLSSLFSITKEELIAACPKEKKQVIKPVTIGQWTPRTPAKFHEIVKQKCLVCHTSPVVYQKEETAIVYYDENGKRINSVKKMFKKEMPPIDLSNINLKIASKLLKAVTEKNPANRMPKGSSLKATEIQEFYEFTKDLELGSKLNEPQTEIRRPIFAYTYSDEKVETMLKEYKEQLSSIVSKNERDHLYEKFKKNTYCQYQQKGCAEVIESLTKERIQYYTKSSPKMKPEELNTKLEKDILSLKCQYSYDVIRDQCPGLP